MSKVEYTSIVKLYQFIFNDGSQLYPTFYNLSNIKWFSDELLMIFFWLKEWNLGFMLKAQNM